MIENLQKHIETIINNTFEAIDELYRNNKENDEGKFDNKKSRLVFPKYRDKEKIRVSEQELRFLFVEEFIKYINDFNKNKKNTPLNLFYSIETPTEEKYLFKETPKKHIPHDEEGGQSAQFDLVIFDESKKRVCLIEFKNNSNDAEEHEKDFLKLSVEGNEDTLCYFISIAESSNGGTLGNKDRGILHKMELSKNNKEINFDNIVYICHCIDDNNGNGFKTIYDGIVSSDFGWKKIDQIFEK